MLTMNGFFYKNRTLVLNRFFLCSWPKIYNFDVTNTPRIDTKPHYRSHGLESLPARSSRVYVQYLIINITCNFKDM